MKAISAKTTHRNTRESDLMARVLHDVRLSNGLTVQVMAIDPIDAINQVNEMIKNHVSMVLK